MGFVKTVAGVCACVCVGLQDDFGKFLSAIGEYLNTDATGKQSAGSGVYDNEISNLANDARDPGIER